MAFLFSFLLQEAVREVVEVAAVATVAATTTYVAGREIGRIIGDCWEESTSSSRSRGCGNPPVKTIWDWWGNGLTSEEYYKLEGWGYDLRTKCFPLQDLKTIIRCEKNVGQPPVNEPGWEEKYEPEKNWDGKRKGVNDKSPKRGYPDKKGRVWVPNDHMHGEGGGEPGWDVQVDGGEDHFHVRAKDGKVRRHPK